jgi:cobalt/nickel transport system ATP-binding protein
MPPLIQIHNLEYAYPDGRIALKGIHLDVERGEKIALVGANGAGKSTLLLQLNGVLQGQGRICIDGHELNQHNLGRIRSMVGLVFQNPDDQLFSPTVYEDVAFGPIYQGLEKQVVAEKTAQALADVHMQGYEQRNPYHLSGGEKKRIAIATVLSMQPEVLIFDEPTAGLDPRARRELIELLAELPQTMLIATHDLAMAAQLTPRTVVLNAGQITADGTTLDILENNTLLMENGLI